MCTLSSSIKVYMIPTSLKVTTSRNELLFYNTESTKPRSFQNRTFTYVSRRFGTFTDSDLYTTVPNFPTKMCQFARIEYEECRHVSKEVIECEEGCSEPKRCPQAHPKQYTLSGKCVDCREAAVDKRMKELGLL